MDSVDYYAILGVGPQFTRSELKKAYLKLALKYHPDKNKGSEAAQKRFQEVVKAYDTLRNDEERAQYDARLRGKQLRLQREREMDGKRKRMKETLELREKAHKRRKTEEAREKAKLEREKELLRLLAAETDELVRSGKAQHAGNEYVIAVRWITRPGYGYNEGSLRKIFSKYGKLESVLLVESCSALVTFRFAAQAVKVMELVDSLGHEDNPLMIEWASGEAPKMAQEVRELKEKKSTSPSSVISSAPSMHDFEEQERLVLAQLMAAAKNQQ